MFGSFGAGFGSFGSGVGGLLPSFTNITSWLKTPTADGKTLANSKGTDANLTGVNCLSFDGSNDRIDLLSVPSDLLEGVFDISFDILIDDSDTGFQRIIWFIGTTDFFRIQKNNGSNTLDFWARNSSSNTIFRNSGISFTPDVMFNFRAVGDGTDVKVYYDDVLHVTISITGANKQASFTSATPSLSQSTNALLGKLANFKMSSGSVLHTQLPIAEGSGTKDYDVSGNGNHGAITGATWSTQDGIESWNHEYGFDIDGAVKVPALNTKTKQVATFDGVADKLTATGITGSSVITHDGTATLTAGTGEITSTAGTAYNIKVDGVLTFTMSTGIGTSTITSENGAIGNASVTVGAGGLDSFWGQRVADASGSLVSADYATGNTSISNPAGFVHNNSECGVSMVTNSLTAAQLFAIDNSTATQTFIRKDNGNIVQILDYSAALTGSDLDRTRSYVG